MQHPPLDPPRAAALRTPRSELTYTFLASMFVVVLVLTNIIGTKLFVLFPNGGPAWILGGEPWTLTSGILTYPLTFFLTETRPNEFARYLQTLAARDPLTEYTRDARIADFSKAFGGDTERLETNCLRYFKRLK